jgi:hypothetical protein
MDVRSGALPLASLGPGLILAIPVSTALRQVNVGVGRR